MEDARMFTPRRALSLALVSALLGAGAALLVVTHPFTDEGDGGLHLLGSHGPGRPGAPGQPGLPGDAMPPGWSHRDLHGWSDRDAPPGWSHGDKDGWQGGPVPPGWAKHDKSASKHQRQDERHGHEDHGAKPGKSHDGH